MVIHMGSRAPDCLPFTKSQRSSQSPPKSPNGLQNKYTGRVLLFKNGSDPRPQTRNRDGQLVRYLDLPVRGGDRPIALAEVLLGPNQNQMLGEPAWKTYCSAQAMKRLSPNIQSFVRPRLLRAPRCNFSQTRLDRGKRPDCGSRAGLGLLRFMPSSLSLR